MNLDSTLHVDGAVEGSIDSSSDVSIGESGTLEGNLRAQLVMISGYVNGKIDCERLEIVANGKVYGEVSTREFIIEPGGQFIGESHVKGTESLRALERQDEHAVQPLTVTPETDLQQA